MLLYNKRNLIWINYIFYIWGIIFGAISIKFAFIKCVCLFFTLVIVIYLYIIINEETQKKKKTRYQNIDGFL